MTIALAATAVEAGAQTRPDRGAPADSVLIQFLATETPRLMQTMSIPGAIVVLTRGGRLLMNTGFGKSSLAPVRLVDAEHTAFRTASVGKVFTAIAVLQQVERGHIGLADDVRPLIPDVKFAGREGPALTLHQLLTHTAGFDEQLIGYLNAPSEAAVPLDRYLASAMPARSRVSDGIPGYSNHGYALAGLVVERLARQSFVGYAHDSVFTPLGMHHTAFVRDMRDTVGMNVALEYRSSGEPRIMRTSRPYPAANVVTTGADMASFLVALNLALRGDSSGPLSPRVARWIVGRALSYHPDMPPMGYGLSGVPIAGRTVWMKGGASPSHSAVIAVIPELELGLFIAVNRQEPMLWDQLVQTFVERFFAQSDSAGRESRVGVAADLTATYRWNRTALRSAEKILGLAAQVTVTRTASGVTLTGPTDVAGRYVSRSALLFQRSDGHRLAFRLDSGGHASRVFSLVQGQPVAFERIGTTETASAQLGIVGVALILSIVTGSLALRSNGQTSRPPRWARVAAVTLPIAEMTTLISAVALVRQTDLLAQGPTVLLRVTLVLATMTTIAAAVQIAGTTRLATWPTSGLPARACYWTGAAGAVALIWFFNTNSLIGHWR